MAGDAAAFRQRLEEWIEPLEHGDKERVLDWVEQALTSADVADRVLLAGCIEGSIQVSGVRDGEVVFRLTEAGHHATMRLMMDSAEARHQFKSLRGGAAVDEPKEPQ